MKWTRLKDRTPDPLEGISSGVAYIVWSKETNCFGDPIIAYWRGGHAKFRTVGNFPARGDVFYMPLPKPPCE